MTGVLTLDGPEGATWVIKIGTLGTCALTGTGFSVVMAGGGQACDVTVTGTTTTGCGELPPVEPSVDEECQSCAGGVTELTLQNNGATGNVLVTDKKGGVLFNGTVDAGADFSFQGLGSDGKMGTEITITTDAGTITVHTSCSKPIGVGSVFGDFTVIAGSSRGGGQGGVIA